MIKERAAATASNYRPLSAPKYGTLAVGAEFGQRVSRGSKSIKRRHRRGARP